MGRLRRRIRVERLESRALLAATIGIPDLVVDPTAPEPQVVASLEIENAPGIRGATVEIHYDPKLLQPDAESIRAGSIWDGRGMAIANVNDQDGTITAFIFATQQMSLSQGSLLDIDFLFHDETAGDARANIGIGSLRLNEGDIPISSVPIRGQSTIDGSITRQELPIATQPTKSPVPPPYHSPMHALKLWTLGDTPAEGEQPRIVKPDQEHLPVDTVAARAAAEARADRYFCEPWAVQTAVMPPLAGVTQPESEEAKLHPLATPDAATGAAVSRRRPAVASAAPAGVAAFPGGGVAPESGAETTAAPAASPAPLAGPFKRAAEATGPFEDSPKGLKEIQIFTPLPAASRGPAIIEPLIWLLNGRGADRVDQRGSDLDPADAA